MLSLFVKFGSFQQTWVKNIEGDKKLINELFFFGVDASGKSTCLRVHKFPATCRFALEAGTSPERELAFDSWLRSAQFKKWVITKVGDKAHSRDGVHVLEPDDLLFSIKKSSVRPADRPSKENWTCWEVSFCAVCVAAAFAYDKCPFADTPFPEVRVFSSTKTGNVLLQEFYRRTGTVPFTWWQAKGAVAVKTEFLKKAVAGVGEHILLYEDNQNILPLADCPPRPATSCFVFDIESVKNYHERWENGFDSVADTRRALWRKEVDVADPKNKGILNSWHDHKVCNIHVLFWSDWNCKSREPDKSICLVLNSWDGANFTEFQGGDIDAIHRPDLFSKETTICTYSTEAALLQDFYLTIKRLDPDIITGWNILGYDLWMLEKRAIDALKLPRSTLQIGRLRGRNSFCSEMHFQTAGKGSFGGKKQIEIAGRAVVDGMYALQKDFSARVPLTSFSLNAAADYYAKGILGDFATKDDLPYAEMRRAFSKRDTRTFFCKYCLKDTYLTALVIQSMDLISLYEAFCTFVGIEMHAVVFKGETERTLPNLRRRYESQTPVLAMEVLFFLAHFKNPQITLLSCV